MKKIPVILLVLFCACRKNNMTPPSAGEAGQYTDSITVDGHFRTFIVTLPDGWNNQSLPVVFALHGGGGTADGMETLTGFKTIALREKFILVYPQGIEKSWNDGRPTEANLLGINDVNFFNSMITYLSSRYSVNQKMIYCTGISNGGFMTSTLAYTLSNRFAACAVDAATIDSIVIAVNNDPGPVSMIYMHGTADPIVPFAGGTTTIGTATEGAFVSHVKAVGKWVQLNHCTGTPVITTIPDNAGDGTTITESDYKNGTSGTEVISYVIENGGHTWPGGWQYLPQVVVGKTTKNLNASEAAWSFFKAHPKP